MKSLLKDPDIARLFENTFPNTLGNSSESLRVRLAGLTMLFRYHGQVF